MNLLAIRSINPSKYALSLMDSLFTDEEMSTKCFAVSSRSNKPPLPKDGGPAPQAGLDTE